MFNVESEENMAKKVLVVDDEKLIVKGIRFSLEQDGMEEKCVGKKDHGQCRNADTDRPQQYSENVSGKLG